MTPREQVSELFVQRARLRTAAYHAKKRYPGVVGDVLSAELLFWESVDTVFPPDARMKQLVDHLMTTDN